MQEKRHPISLQGSSASYELRSFHFGAPGRGNKAYIQAGLHADEVPGMLVAQHLRAELQALDVAGKIRGEVVLVPAANPLGLAQAIQGTPFGRFDLSSGVNFNRGYAHVADQLKAQLAGRLGPDPQANVATVRALARAAVAARVPTNDAQALKQLLLGLAIDADVVLDLHCDNEAVLHLYTGTPLAPACAPLAALLGAHAVLLAREAGDEPFDEACSRLWWELAEHAGPMTPIPLACVAATVELRGEMDVDHALARQDAGALLAFLAERGIIERAPMPLPPPLCQPTPLEAVEPVVAPHAGIVVFAKRLGQVVEAGEALAELIEPVSGKSTVLRAGVAGVFFARTAHRHLLRGMQVGKIAGATPFRAGKLLSQ